MATRAEIEYKPTGSTAQIFKAEVTGKAQRIIVGDTAFLVWDSSLANGRTMGNLGIFSLEEAEKIFNGKTPDFSRETWPLSSVEVAGQSVTVPSTRMEDFIVNKELFLLNQRLKEKYLKVTKFTVQG